MTDMKDVIVALKEVRKEKNLSYDKILELMQENGVYLSKSTLSRVFADGSEDKSFRYEETIRPIANALLDIETIENDDDTDTQAYKSILKLKKDLIIDYAQQNKDLKEELRQLKERQELLIDREKLKYHEKLEAETQKFQKSLAFLKEQVGLKDKRIDQLLDSNDKLLESNHQLLNRLLRYEDR